MGVFDSDGGDNPVHLGAIELGTLNDSSSQLFISVDTGNGPTPVSIDSSDGDFYVLKGCDEGKQAFDVCKNAQWR